MEDHGEAFHVPVRLKAVNAAFSFCGNGAYVCTLYVYHAAGTGSAVSQLIQVKGCAVPVVVVGPVVYRACGKQGVFLYIQRQGEVIVLAS